MRTIEQIMEQDNVGERRAYVIRRQESAQEALRQPASQSLKEGLLLALLNGGKCNAKDLAKRVQRMGFAEAEHGVVHVIWSLQKDQLVKFYETKKSGITGITLTPQGYQKARTLSRRVAEESVVEIRASQEMGSEPSPVKEPDPVVPQKQTEAPQKYTEADMTARYPAIAGLVQRKARVEQAAKLLEDAGLIDQAASALEAIEQTELETEVLALVRELRE